MRKKEAEVPDRQFKGKDAGCSMLDIGVRFQDASVLLLAADAHCQFLRQMGYAPAKKKPLTKRIERSNMHLKGARRIFDATLRHFIQV